MLPMSSWRRSANGLAVYQDSIVFLRAACAQIRGTRREVSRLQQSLESYLLPTSSVDAIVRSSGCRKLLLELASELNLYDDAGFKSRLRTDEQRLATLLGSIFDSKTNEAIILRLQGDTAQVFLDVVQDAIDQGFLTEPEDSRRARRIIRKLSESCDKLPSSLFITGVTNRDIHPTFGGGFADVYRASYGNKTVALKHMRYFLRGAELRRVNLKFCREALVWKDLHHPNILPFLGIDRDTFPSSLCMVSPWMEHGTVLNHLQKHGHTNVDKLLCEIILGVHYLHSRNIVHGDLRGANILINEHWSACLSDFGLSSFNTATTSMHTSTRSGSIYWMAPELISPERFGLQFSRTPASDVYAFACVCVELYTGRPPFSKLTEAAALFAVINGERQERPSGVPAMSDALWQFVSVGWSQNPATRPATAVVAQNLTWLARQKQSRSPKDHSPVQPQASSVPLSAAPEPDPHRQEILQSPHQQTGLLTRLFAREKSQPQTQLEKQIDIRLSISERDEGTELAHKIRQLTTTDREDWALLLDVCNHASFNEANAQEAVHALRRELKEESTQQLAAVRIWAILLRNTSNIFLSQSSSRKFLSTVEEVVLSPTTSPTVRERVLAVVAASAYATASKKYPGFRKLWKRIKPADAPENGIPLQADDPIFGKATPPVADMFPTQWSLGMDIETYRNQRKRNAIESASIRAVLDLDMLATTEESPLMTAAPKYRAEAIFAYKADDPKSTCLSFSSGTIFDILEDDLGRPGWWLARTTLGRSIGEVPSHLLAVFRKAEARSDWGDGYFSFRQGEILDVRPSGDLSECRAVKENGDSCVVPFIYFKTVDLELARIVRSHWPEISPSPLSALPAISTQGVTNAKETEARAARPPSRTESLPPYRDDRPIPGKSVNKARAVPSYVATAEDPDVASFRKDEVNKARAISSYVATAEDPDGVSFHRDEIVEIINRIGHWLLIQTTDGRRGITTSDYFTPVSDTEDPDSESDLGVPPSEERSDHTRGDFQPESADDEHTLSVNTVEESGHQSVPEIPMNPPLPQWKEKKWVGSTAATQGEVEWFDSDVLPGYFDEPLLPRAGVSFKARAAFSHVAILDDPDGISFRANEIITIIDQRDFRWRVQTGDGRCGKVSSDYFDIPIISYDVDPRSSLAIPRCKYKAEALCDYTADDAEGLSFGINEILDILHDNGDWWYARRKSGLVGAVSPHYFLVLQPARALDFWQDDKTLSFVCKGEIMYIHPIGSSQFCRVIKEDESWFSVPYNRFEILEPVGEE